jgi:hypothetical protein
VLPWSLPVASQASPADLLQIVGIVSGDQANKIRHLRLFAGFRMHPVDALNLD